MENLVIGRHRRSLIVKKRRSYKNDIEQLMKNSNKQKIRQINTLVVPNNGERYKKITISIRRLVLHYLIPMTLQNVLFKRV